MIRTLPLLLIAALALTACKDDAPKDDTGLPPGETGDTGDTGDTIPDEPLTDFESGGYRVTSMELLNTGEGFDLNDDGEPDNKLPAVLMLLDMAVEDDMSRDGLNATIAAAIEAGDLVQLIEASHSHPVLHYDLLLGAQAEDGTISLDEAQSYDAHGQPYSRFTGAFSDQVTVELGPDDVQIPVAFYPDEPAIMIPVWQSVASGEIDADGTTCTMGGAIPVALLMSQVVEPLIPDEGYDGQTKEELMEDIEALLSSDSVADIELDGGAAGISAALTFVAEPATW
jgi:hypothetical protein